MRTTLLAAFVCLALSGCGSDGPRTDEAAQLARCVSGWWQDPAPGACSCPGASECGAADCAAIRVIGFDEEHTSFTGIVQTSESARTATPTGSLSEGSWTAEAGAIRITPADAPAYSAETSCQANELVMNHLVKVRAPDWLAVKLAAAAAEQGGK